MQGENEDLSLFFKLNKLFLIFSREKLTINDWITNAINPTIWIARHIFHSHPWDRGMILSREVSRVQRDASGRWCNWTVCVRNPIRLLLSKWQWRVAIFNRPKLIPRPIVHLAYTLFYKKNFIRTKVLLSAEHWEQIKNKLKPYFGSWNNVRLQKRTNSNREALFN